MGQRRYQATGFIPVVSPPSRVTRLAADFDIYKGDALFDNGSGYATNQEVTLASDFLGVAAADCLNSGGDDLSVEIYPYSSNTLYIVPVGTNAEIDRDDVGTLINLIAGHNKVAINTTVTTGIGFFVENFDVSTKAVDANEYGYAIGRFRNQTAQS